MPIRPGSPGDCVMDHADRGATAVAATPGRASRMAHTGCEVCYEAYKRPGLQRRRTEMIDVR
jgi:hypothetical protein